MPSTIETSSNAAARAPAARPSAVVFSRDQLVLLVRRPRAAASGRSPSCRSRDACARAAASMLAGDRLLGVIEPAASRPAAPASPRSPPSSSDSASTSTAASAPCADQSPRRSRGRSASRKLSGPTRSATCSTYAGRWSSTRTSSRSAPSAALAGDAARSPRVRATRRAARSSARRLRTARRAARRAALRRRTRRGARCGCSSRSSISRDTPAAVARVPRYRSRVSGSVVARSVGSSWSSACALAPQVGEPAAALEDLDLALEHVDRRRELRARSPRAPCLRDEACPDPRPREASPPARRRPGASSSSPERKVALSPALSLS